MLFSNVAPFFLITLRVVLGDAASPSFDDVLEDILFEGILKYETANVKIPLLNWAVKQVISPPRRNLDTTNGRMCIACAAVSKYFLIRTRFGISRARLVQVLEFVCQLFKIQTKRVCNGLIQLNIDTFMYIVKNKRGLTEQKICATIFQNFKCFKNHRSRWFVYIPNKITSENAWQRDENISDQSHRILHLTDLHIDPLYQSGSNAACNEPLCCQRDQGNVTDSNNAAGKWGDFRNCDMPYYSFINLLQQVTKSNKEQLENQYDYVYFTGDIISHRIWDTSKEGNTEDIEKTYKLLEDAFGSTPVFPILGNHEPHPLNVFSPHFVPDNLSTQWIFNLMIKVWSRWLPPDTHNTILDGGYYTVVVKPGFRIIALNSNVCYIYNWWLLYEDRDPFYQLHWLSVTLAEAEEKQEAVHILSHVPPGDDTCLYEWTRQYREIVQRFSHVIKAQFNGHTHWDELRVFYNKYNSSEVINVAYVGGSFTTFSNLNPNYRVYTVDSKSHELLNFDQWTYQMDLANKYPNSTPEWYKLYSFKEAYGLNGLKNKDIEGLIQNFAQNETMLQEYYRFKIRESTPGLLEGCDKDCLNSNLCSMVTTEVDDNLQCDIFT